MEEKVTGEKLISKLYTLFLKNCVVFLIWDLTLPALFCGCQDNEWDSKGPFINYVTYFRVREDRVSESDRK